MSCVYLYNTIMSKFDFNKEYTIRLLFRRNFAADLIRNPISGDVSNLIIFHFHNKANQRWRFLPVDKSEGYLIVSSYNGGVVTAKNTNNNARLDVGKIETNPGGNNIWFLKPIPGKAGGYTIATEKGDVLWYALGGEIQNDDGIGLLSAGKEDSRSWEILPVQEFNEK